MWVSTVVTPSALPDGVFFDAIVVIDTLRATTSIVTALTSGATAVLPCLSLQEAQERKALEQWKWWTGGEVGGRAPSGFDLGNSPREMVRPWEGRGLLLATTNGTKAIRRATKCGKAIWIGCLRNRDAVSQAVRRVDRLLLLCSGDHDEASLEDLLTAGAIAERWIPEVEADDMTVLACLAWQQAKEKLYEVVTYGSRNARHLIEIGLTEDIPFALQLDQTTLVPRWDTKTASILSPASPA